jgi:hypothetical protein
MRTFMRSFGKATITKVIQDTVELFGVNFQVSMESVYTTLDRRSMSSDTAALFRG